MKTKTKKTFSAFLSTAIVLTQMSVVSPVQAADANDVCIPYDMTSMYNTGNIYSSVKTETGSAGFTGAFNYDDFISDKFITWKNEWTESMTDNVLIHNGIDYNMRVIDRKNNSNSSPAIWKNTDTAQFTDFDVIDSNYKTLELLANNDMGGSLLRTVVVKLNYTDGTSTYSSHNLTYFRNPSEDYVVSSVNDSNWTVGELEGRGYINHISVPIDETKELDSFSILNQKFTYTENDDGSVTIGDVVVPDDGSFVRYSHAPHAVAVYAATMTMSEEKYKEDIFDNEIVYLPYDMTSMYNTSNIYLNGANNGSAGFSGAFSYDDVRSGRTILWKKSWTDGMIDNTLIHNGTEFDIRVALGSAANCVWKNNADTNVEFTVFDVIDGVYNTVEFLANADMQGSTKYLLVRLDYTDGTSTYTSHQLPYFSNAGGSDDIVAYNGNLSGTGGVRHITIPVNTKKELASFSVLNDRFDCTLVSETEATITKSAEYNRFEKATYAVTVYAVSVTTTKGAYKGHIIDNIKDAIDSIVLPITADHKAELDKIGDMIKQAQEFGISTSEIAGYSMYMSYVTQCEKLQPIEVIVNMEGMYNMNKIYSNTSSSGLAGCPESIDYDAFKAESFWTNAWEEGMTTNILRYTDTSGDTAESLNGTHFKLRVVNSTNDTSNVVLSNGVLPNTEDKTWTNVDVDDSNYSAIRFLANSSHPNNNVLSVRLNYEDGVEYRTGTVAPYISNAYSYLTVRRWSDDGTVKQGGIKCIEYSVDVNRKLVSYDILNNDCTMAEDGTVTGTASALNYALNIYAMTLISTQSAVDNVKAELIDKIVAKIDALTGTASDYENYQAVTDLLAKAEEKGIALSDITNLQKYESIGKNYVNLADVAVSNDTTNAKVVLTLEKAASAEILANATYTLKKDSAAYGSVKAVASEDAKSVTLTFAHENDYDTLWAIEVKIGSLIDYVLPVELVKPYTLENVTVYEGSTAISNFYEAESGTFTLKGDIVKTTVNSDVYLALYDDLGALVQIKLIADTATELNETFTVTKSMNDKWSLKYFVWEEGTMKPYIKSRVLN